MKRPISRPIARGLERNSDSGGITPSGPFTTSAAGPYIISPSAVVPAATSKITVSMLVNLSSASAEYYNSLFSFSNGAEHFRVYAGKNGKLFFLVADDTGATVSNSGNKTGNVLSLNTPQSLTFSLDLANKLTVANVTKGHLSGYILTAGSGVMATDLKFHALRNPAGAMQFEGSVEYIKVWFGEATTDGSEPTTTPDIEITGPASVINSHPWKLGVDAT